MIVWIFNTIVYIIGFHALILAGIYIVESIYLMISKPFNLLSRYGKGWALITGASDGIGEGFCYELARDGFNICLVSRTKSKLERVESNIKSINPNIQTKIVIAEFTKGYNHEFYQKLFQEIGDIDISVLVNNVGIKNLGNFQDLKAEALVDETVVNTFPMTILTRRILPKMMQRKERSGIINVSSLRGTLPFARMPGYSGTKKFNDIFSRALSYEVEGKYKVDVMCLRPMYVTSQMTHQIKGPHVITPEECARGALNLVGKERATNGHWKHRLQAFLILSLPPQVSYMSEARRTKRLLAEQDAKKSQ